MFVIFCVYLNLNLAAVTSTFDFNDIDMVACEFSGRLNLTLKFEEFTFIGFASMGYHLHPSNVSQT